MSLHWVHRGQAHFALPLSYIVRSPHPLFYQVHAGNLHTVHDTIDRAGYRSDLLMRSLPRWVAFLDTAAEAAFGAWRVLDKGVPEVRPYARGC